MSENVEARRWTINLYNSNAGEEGYMNPETERALALALLRDRIRLDQAGIVVESLTRDAAAPVLVVDGVQVDMAHESQATGTIGTWSASGFAFGLDSADLLPDSTDPDGVVWYEVPESLTRDGGDVRLRHNLDGPVTVRAYQADMTPVGYHISAEIDQNVMSVVLLPGAASLGVTRDPDVICGCGEVIRMNVAGDWEHKETGLLGDLGHRPTPKKVTADG